jgi:hypothetical protein
VTASSSSTFSLHLLGLTFPEPETSLLAEMRSPTGDGRSALFRQDRRVMINQIRLLVLISGFLFPIGLLAQEEQARKNTPAVDFLYTFLPLVIVGGILWIFLRKTQSSPFMRRSMEHFERSEQHMQRVEQIGERIAAALEKQNEDAGSFQGPRNGTP